MIVTGGATNVSCFFSMKLAATGADATGLTISDFDMQYTRIGESPTAKVDAVALAAANTAHTDNRGIEVDPTDQPGLYRFDWPDAAFAAGVREVGLSIKHASCITEHLRVEIGVDVNVVSWSGTAVATVDTAGYPVVTVKDGTGQGELNTSGGRVSADVARWLGTAVATPAVAGVPSVDAITLAGAEPTATLDTIKADTTAIKAKTDSLTFTVAGQADANVQYVNDVQVTGTGASGDEWGP